MLLKWTSGDGKKRIRDSNFELQLEIKEKKEKFKPKEKIPRALPVLIRQHPLHMLSHCPSSICNQRRKEKEEQTGRERKPTPQTVSRTPKAK
jgi:hypothetical protein